MFQLALTKQATERSLFLERECGDDKALRQRLDALLAAHKASVGVLGDEAAREDLPPTLDLPEPAAGEAVGMTLGRYTLREKFGEGGCGTVYVAEQTQPVRRRVALKVIKLGMDTKQVVARFEAGGPGVSGAMMTLARCNGDNADHLAQFFDCLPYGHR